MVGRSVGGCIGRPLADCWSRVLAVQRGWAIRCCGTINSAGNERLRRARSPVIDSSAFGAATCVRPGAHGGVDSGVLGVQGDTLNPDARDDAMWHPLKLRTGHTAAIHLE